MYPRVVVNKKSLRQNHKILLEEAARRGISVFVVTKVYTADLEIAKIAAECGAEFLADSRTENLKKLGSLNKKRVLLRLPQHSEIREVIDHSEISLNSEISTIKMLGRQAAAQDKTHGIILMVDLGDLREGMAPADIPEAARTVLNTEGLALEGIGVNLTCYGGVLPSKENMQQLADLAEQIETENNIKLNFVSGGNSSSISIMMDGDLPSKINNLRLGESLVRGRETAYLKDIPGMTDDCFTFEAEIIELKEKPSVPTGIIGFDAFGNKPEFNDRGMRLRAIVAVGKQDIKQDGLFSYDSGIKLIGGSSDHTIFDLTDAGRQYKVGDILKFKMDYGAILQAFTSGYVKKIYQD